MKIDEIINMSDREVPIVEYLKFFNNAAKIPAFESLKFAEATTAWKDHYLGLFSDNDLISILHVSPSDHELFQVTYSQTELEFRRCGCFRFLLLKALSTHGSILSDYSQSNDAKKAWKSLIQYPGPNMDIYIFNANNAAAELIPAASVTDSDRWNNKQIPVLLAKKSAITEIEYPVKAAAVDRLLENTGIDRTYMGIWFGKNSSNSTYDNP